MQEVGSDAGLGALGSRGVGVTGGISVLTDWGADAFSGLGVHGDRGVIDILLGLGVLGGRGDGFLSTMGVHCGRGVSDSRPLIVLSGRGVEV